MTTEKINSNKPIPLKKETIEPFISFEKNGIRPVIGFTQTEYRGDGKIHKNFYGGYNKIAQGKEEYISIGDGFLSASDAMIAILKQVNIPVKSKQSQPEQPEIDCAEMSFNAHFATDQTRKSCEGVKEYQEWIRSDRPFNVYPIGTKARADGGGYWIKNERGWKWWNGDTFPIPGGDWDGYVCLPETHPLVKQSEIPDDKLREEPKSRKERVDEARLWLSNMGYGTGTNMTFDIVGILLDQYLNERKESKK